MRRALLAAAVLSIALTTPAGAVEYAPLDSPGPALGVPAATLDAALACTPGVAGASRAPVLLSPATGVTPEQNYSWNYERALDRLGIPWCAVTMPHRTLDDIQVAGEYLVHAIRTMYARAGRRIAILGHSQGGMSMRWALRFWPDTRAMVDDVVSFAASNHGTTLVTPALCRNGCSPATLQQGSRSSFVAALNSGAETFGGISYTQVYTRTDAVVAPNADDRGSSSLHGGGGAITNVATQDICPRALYEHLAIGTIDPVAYALAVDALGHDGPARPERIPRRTCAQVYQPGVDPLNAANFLQAFAAVPGLITAIGPTNLTGAPFVREEPPLRCYVTGACTVASSPTRSCMSRRRFTVRADGLRNLRAPRVVTQDGRRLRVLRRGRPVAVVDLRTVTTRRPVLVRIRGGDARGRRVTVTRRFHPCRPGPRVAPVESRR
jgi:hypothetical protein